MIALKGLIVSLVLSLLLTLGAGCNLLPNVETAPPSSPPVVTNTPPATNGTLPANPEWTIPVGADKSPVLPSIADVVAKVKPSVVAINIKVTGYDIFNRPSTQEGAGSGWIIREDGIIVTNNHVVDGANDITVTLDDGRTFSADLNTVHTDTLTDLAIFKIDAENLPAAIVGDSTKLSVGSFVVAIGNSLGQGIRATMGIVSSKGVSMTVDQGQTLYNLIETDAAINPGNSGGPLVNMAGEVIGITSAKIAATGVEGMGYAIPVQEAAPIIEQLISTGFVVRPFLGVQGLLTVDQSVAAYFNLSINKGALIRGIVRGGPAEKAGLQAGDVITKFGDKEISEVNELTRAIHSSETGAHVEITFWRDKTENTTSVLLTESPPPK
ncbi:S1C family serine protease [Chloroflexota bacterium]